MPNNPAPLTVEEVNKAKLRCDEATPGRWWQDDYSMFVFAGKVPMKICDIRGWGYLTGFLKLTETQAELQQAANCDFIMHAREDLPRALDTIEQQRDQIASLDTANAGLRRRLHIVDQHNQHFERCESTWCNPNGTLVVGTTEFAISLLLPSDPSIQGIVS